MSEYRLKPPKQAETMTSVYKKIEDTVVGAYKKIEDTVVSGYKNIEEKFVDAFLVKAEDSEARPAAPVGIKHKK